MNSEEIKNNENVVPALSNDSIVSEPVPTPMGEVQNGLVDNTQVQETAPTVDNNIPAVDNNPVITVSSMAGGDEKFEVNEQKNDDVITSGTASEEEISIDASKEKVEVLDEYEISKDASDAKKADKKRVAFIVIIFLILFAFIFFMRPLIKWIGI